MSHFPKQVLRLAVTGLLLVLLIGGVWLFNNRAVTPQTTQASPNPVVLDQATQPPLPEASPSTSLGSAVADQAQIAPSMTAEVQPTATPHIVIAPPYPPPCRFQHQRRRRSSRAFPWQNHH